jgi:DNA-binding XRE family transcriptional regulator
MKTRKELDADRASGRAGSPLGAWMGQGGRLSFGRRLATVRRLAGLSQGEAAAQLGLSERTVRRWELGEYAPIALHAQLVEARLDEWLRQAEMQIGVRKNN